MRGAPPDLSIGVVQVGGGLTITAGHDVGVVIVDLYQPALTHTVRKEVDPLEWTELVGNIGGTCGEQWCS